MATVSVDVGGMARVSTHCHNIMAVVLVWLLWLHSLRLYHVTSIPKGAPPRLRGPLAGQDATLPQPEPEP